MKIRLKDDSIRVRIGPGEMQQLLTVGALESATRFGAERALRYRVGLAEIAATRCSFKSDQIEILLPRSEAAAWARSGEVGIGGTQSWGAGQALEIAVEKDFACLDHPERDTDVFPNPAGECGTSAK